MFWAFSNRWRRANGWALAAALLAAGCTGRAPEASVPAKTVADWFAIKVGGQVVQMQVALNAAEMSHGLMERRDLGRDQGMLFVYPEPLQMSFWMRDTPLPLDIGFFDRGGVLREVYAMQPFDESAIRSRSTRLQFALEMNQGWFHDRGVRPGAWLDLAALREALKARGATPADFGLR
ncbi:MAG TPA: DUF192 domain-containing protein [Opitutaceae bacterium]|nr:DUF192 domain-containing protein [Opitutaceae bacterium]